MKLTSIRSAVVPSIAILALGLSGCGASNEGDEGSDGGAEQIEGLSGTFQIGGASSQEEAQKAWVTGFQTANPEVTINYDPVGSGGGRENFISGAFAVAGSDSYLKDDGEETELSDAKETCAADPIEVPNYVSPIAIIHSLDGVDLQLSPETLASIFAGKITKWNDPAIVEDNPDADLPSANINAVHRSDESGTTGNFTNYLSVAAPDAWTDGEIETWPAKAGGEGAKGTSGVVQAVSKTPNSIGYADASQAGDLGAAKIGVGDEFVEPSPEAAAKILEVSPKAEGASDNQMIYDLDYLTEESGTYPIVLTSYMLACPTYEDETEAEFAKAYLTYVIGKEGQEFAQKEAGNAPLSEGLQEDALAIVEQISVR